jgi:hypothetical protein
MSDPPSSPVDSPQGEVPESESRDRCLTILRVAQGAATAAELCAEASNNEALTWIARASRVLLGLAVGWRIRTRRRRR